MTEKPAPGKTVAWLQCELPSCESFTPGFEQAVEKLGWNLKVIVYKSGEPGPAVQQAVNEKVDYITITGDPLALYEPQAKAAKAAGIPIISANDTTPPDPAKDLYAQFGDASMFENQSVQMAQWILGDTGTEPAHIAYVTIEDYPILEAAYPPIQSTIGKYCSECTVEKLPVTVEDLGEGKAVNKIAALLQTHPDTNYLYFSFPDIMIGVPEALAAAGLTGVKMVGNGLGESPLVIESIANGTVPAWVAQPISYQDWLAVDAMARLSLGMELTEERKAAREPTWVIDSPSSLKYLEPQGFWKGPTGFEKEFEELWGL